MIGYEKIEEETESGQKNSEDEETEDSDQNLDKSEVSDRKTEGKEGEAMQAMPKKDLPLP